MNNNNNKQKGRRAAKAAATQQSRKQLRNQLLNELRAAAGQPAQGRGRGKRNRQAKRAQAPGGISNFFAPVAIGTSMKKTDPQWMYKNAKCERLVHREKVAKVSSPGTGVFTVLRTLALNPGLFATFPWLAQVAQAYESYVFHRVRIYWIPAVSTAVAGSAMMAPDYDAADAAPVGETALSSYSDADEASIWAPQFIELTPDLLLGNYKRKFIRNGALAANLDIKTYDSANIFIATSDDAAVNVAKIWIEYDVELFNPQVPPGGFFQVSTLSESGGLAAATPFAGTSVAALGSPVLSGATNVLTVTGSIIGQEYFILFDVVGTVISVVSPAATTGATAKFTHPSLVNAAATIGDGWISVTATAETMTFTLSITATTVTSVWVVCSVLAPVPVF